MPTCMAASSPSPSARQPISVSSSCRTSTTAHTAVTASLHWRPPPSNSAGSTGRYPRPAWASTPLWLHRGIRRLGRARRRRSSVRQRAIVRVEAGCLGRHTVIRHRHRRHRVRRSLLLLCRRRRSRSRAFRQSGCEAMKDFGMEVLDAANGKVRRGPPRARRNRWRLRHDRHWARLSTKGSTQCKRCIFADRELDRSPTGSGTAGRLAQLHASGQLAIGDELVNESIIGSTFTGRILAETPLAGRAAIVPEFKARPTSAGSATGSSIDRDPLTHGFQLRNELQTSQ